MAAILAIWAWLVPVARADEPPWCLDGAGYVVNQGGVWSAEWAGGARTYDSNSWTTKVASSTGHDFQAVTVEGAAVTSMTNSGDMHVRVRPAQLGGRLMASDWLYVTRARWVLGHSTALGAWAFGRGRSIVFGGETGEGWRPQVALETVGGILLFAQDGVLRYRIARSGAPIEVSVVAHTSSPTTWHDVRAFEGTVVGIGTQRSFGVSRVVSLTLAARDARWDATAITEGLKLATLVGAGTPAWYAAGELVVGSLSQPDGQRTLHPADADPILGICGWNGAVGVITEQPDGRTQEWLGL